MFANLPVSQVPVEDWFPHSRRGHQSMDKDNRCFFGVEGAEEVRRDWSSNLFDRNM